MVVVSRLSFCFASSLSVSCIPSGGYKLAVRPNYHLNATPPGQMHALPGSADDSASYSLMISSRNAAMVVSRCLGSGLHRLAVTAQSTPRSEDSSSPSRERECCRGLELILPCLAFSEAGEASQLSTRSLFSPPPSLDHQVSVTRRWTLAKTTQLLVLAVVEPCLCHHGCKPIVVTTVTPSSFLSHRSRTSSTHRSGQACSAGKWACSE